MLELLLIALGIVVVLGPGIIAIVALVRLSGVRRRLDELQTQYHVLNQRITDIVSGEGDAEAKPEPSPAPEAVVGAADEAPLETLKDAAQPEDVIADEAEEAGEPPRTTAAAWIEQELTSRWLVWLGGLALAIAGYFLVLYAAEHGLLGPRARIIAGVVLGIALTGAGEYLRRRPMQRAIASVRPDYIPQALTAGGLATLFGSFYAAHGLYGLIGPLSTFVLLTLVAVGAFALSVLHGVFVAILGLLAGFVTPALIPSESPSVITLFGYLAIISAACAAVMWYRPWAWLGFGTVAGGAVWTVIWLIGPYGETDALVLCGYWIAIFGIHMVLAGQTNQDQSPPLWAKLPPAHLPDSIAWAAAFTGVMLIALTGAVDGFSNMHLTGTTAFVLAMLAGGVWRERFDALVILSGVLVLLVFGLWTSRAELAIELRAYFRTEQGFWTQEPPGDAWRLIHWASAMGIVWLFGLYWRMRSAERPHVWAAMSVVVPVLLMASIYGRMSDLLSERLWAVAGLGLAAAFMAPATQLRQAGPPDHLKLPLGIYAVGVIANVSLAMVFLLQEAWLTVALAAQLPAIAWVLERLDLAILRRAALVIAAVCIARLAFNPFLLEYGNQSAFKDQWVLYAYGLPAMAFHAAFIMFKRSDDDLLVTVLEGGRLVFVTMLLSAEIRVFAAGSLASGSFGLLEAGLHASAWLAVAWSRWRAFAHSGRLVNWWGAVILTALGSAVSIGASLIHYGPLLSTVDVGRLPVFNSLAVAYLIPMILTGLILWQARDLLHKLVQRALSTICFVLGWAWLTFETRHAFQGSLLRLHTSDAESYAYSAVWLVASFVMLFAAIYFHRAELRYASLTLIVITVLKVFLVDMAGLEGLYRVAAFLGLGLSLVGIGYVYQRFVFTAQHAKADADAEGSDSANESGSD